MTTAERLVKLKARLAKYETALDAALLAEEYNVSGRGRKMARVTELQKQIDLLESQISALEANSNGSRSVRPAFIPSSRG